MPDPMNLVPSANPASFFALGDGQNQLAAVDWPVVAGTTATILPLALNNSPLEPSAEVGGAEEPNASLLPLSESGIEIAAAATIPDVPNPVAPGSRREGVGVELGSAFDALNSYYSRRDLDFNESDDALFRFASGQRELLDHARTAALQDPFDQEEETIQPLKPSGAPLPLDASESPVFGTTAPASTRGDVRSFGDLRSDDLNSFAGQEPTDSLGPRASELLGAVVLDAEPPLDKAHPFRVSPWEGNQRRHGPLLLLAMSLVAHNLRTNPYPTLPLERDCLFVSSKP
jgi:hypothetical protein